MAYNVFGGTLNLAQCQSRRCTMFCGHPSGTTYN